MLANRLRRWLNIVPTLDECLCWRGLFELVLYGSGHSWTSAFYGNNYMEFGCGKGKEHINVYGGERVGGGYWGAG